MIITNPNTEVIYFKVYEDYFNFPRNKTLAHNTASLYCRRIDNQSGTFFIEYDFYISDDYTKEPFFVYRTKNSFTFSVENEERDLLDLSVQKAKFREEILTFIKGNSMYYPFENLDFIFSQHTDLSLITTQGYYL